MNQGNENYEGTFNLRTKTLYRKSRITPKKSGEFVAVWKRSEDGKSVPFDVMDDIQWLVIEAEKGSGYFMFPQSILVEFGILKSESSLGKRGFRVYSPELKLLSKQAQKTQIWQSEHYHTGAFIEQ